MGHKKRILIAALLVLSCLGLWGTVAQRNAQAGQTLDLSNAMAKDQIRACGFIAPKMILALGSIVGSQDASGVLSEGDLVYIKLEPGKQVKAGDRLAITRVVKEIEHPITRVKLGYQVSFPGRAVILDGKGQTVPAKIEKSFHPIRHGDLITALPPPSSPEVSVRMPDKIKGTVVAAAQEEETISERGVVFIDQGSQNGVIMGDLFTIYQLPYYTDEALEKESMLPLLKVGEGVVIYLEKETSTLLVTHSSQPVYVGDTVVLGKGK